MSGMDEIKKALRDSGLRIPSNASEEMLEAEAAQDPWWCPIACQTGCFWGACATGHCVFQCPTGECSATNCQTGDIFGGEPVPYPEPLPR